MTRYGWGILLVTLVAGSVACNDRTIFVPRKPKLTITPVDESLSYRAVRPDNVETPAREVPAIDVGRVPVYASKAATFELKNETNEELLMDGVALIDADTLGGRWQVHEVNAPTVSHDNAWPKVLEAYGTAPLQITYAPGDIDEFDGDCIDTDSCDRARVGVTCEECSNAVDGIVDALVYGLGDPPVGAPDIEIGYDNFAGPAATDCVSDTGASGQPVTVCKIPEASGIDLGNIGLSASGSRRIHIRNTAACPATPGIDPCDSCALTIDKDPDGRDLGIGFKEGTNTFGYFTFVGSTATPVSMRQRNLDCGATGEAPLLLEFNAPATEGQYTTVIVVESNDPDEPIIEIPVRAWARNAPVAIAKLRAMDPLNPSAPYTDPTDIEPLRRVYLDGRQSYDPADPTDPTLLTSYQWTVEPPPGADAAMFQEQGQNTPLYSFWLPIAGHYVVKLTVMNTSSIRSGDTPEARVEFDCVPGQKLHVQLVWDDSTNDQDLHVTLATQDDRVCNNPWDCHWLNKAPNWFASAPLANPSLDIDDTMGLGPENINIDEPQPGQYRVYVHYYTDYVSGSVRPTKETVRIYLNGVERAEYKRTITQSKAVWAVADITWLPDGSGFVTPYPSDVAGEVGAVAIMRDCSSPGWVFP